MKKREFDFGAQERFERQGSDWFWDRAKAYIEDRKKAKECLERRLLLDKIDPTRVAFRASKIAAAKRQKKHTVSLAPVKFGEDK